MNERSSAVMGRAAVRADAGQTPIGAVSSISIGVITGVLILAFTVIMIAAPEK